MDQPDHGAIIGAVSRLDGKFESFKDDVIRRLGNQDRDLEMLKTAHNVQVGRGLVHKTLFLTIPGGLGAAIVKLVDWFGAHNGGVPPMTPGSH